MQTEFMDIFLTAVLIVSYLAVAVFLLLRNVRCEHLSGVRLRLASAMSVLSVAVFVSDLAAGPGVGIRLVLDITISLVPINLLNSTLWKLRDTFAWIALIAVLQFMQVVMYVLAAAGVVDIGDSVWAFDMAALPVCLSVLLFLYGLWRRIRSVKDVMKSATVWACLTLSVEVIYLLASCLGYMLIPHARSLHILPLLSLMLAGGWIAAGVRMGCDSAFVFLSRHERRIVESMKISHVEVSQAEASATDIYKELYERILQYFDEEKPFLNSELTITDIVKVLFTNKLYISKAISQYTGRNFCQFVNYYRVMYSVESFRLNPDIRVAEMAIECGFNSVASYSMAFRLFMGENPSEWCRKEKYRLAKSSRTTN